MLTTEFLGITMVNDMKVSEKIRTIREINHLTQEDMANQLHMSTNGYANIERGETKVNTDKLEKIAEVFDMTVGELMSFGEKNSAFYFVENISHRGVNIIGSASNSDLVHEISKQQLIIEHQLETIEFQKREIDRLQELVDLLKANKS